MTVLGVGIKEAARRRDHLAAVPHSLTMLPTEVVGGDVQLLAQDAAATEVILINEGTVKLVRIERDGRELIVGLHLAGWFLGGTAAMLGHPLPASAITLSRCRIQRIVASGFLELVRSQPGLSWHLHQAQSREIHDNMKRIAQLGCLRSRQRLEQLLRELAAPHLRESDSPEVRLTLPMRHYEMAGWIGITPEHLSRLLHQMQEERLIRLEPGAIFVQDVSKL